MKDNAIEGGQPVPERTLTFEPFATSNADGHESTSNKFVITVESPIITEKKVSSEDQNGNPVFAYTHTLVSSHESFWASRDSEI